VGIKPLFKKKEGKKLKAKAPASVTFPLTGRSSLVEVLEPDHPKAKAKLTFYNSSHVGD
jgi:hypothetical protein